MSRLLRVQVLYFKCGCAARVVIIKDLDFGGSGSSLFQHKLSPGHAHCRTRQSGRSASAFQRGHSHAGESRAGSGNGTRSEHSPEEGGHRGGPSSRQRVRVLQPYFIVPGKGVASYFRSNWTAQSYDWSLGCSLRAGRVSDQITRLRYGGLQGLSATAMLQDGLRPSHSSGSWQRFASHSWLFCSLAIVVLFHTRQGFASLAAWISHFPSARRSSSSRRGTLQVTYVTIVPRGNEMLCRRGILLASLLELCFIPRS